MFPCRERRERSVRDEHETAAVSVLSYGPGGGICLNASYWAVESGDTRTHAAPRDGRRVSGEI